MNLKTNLANKANYGAARNLNTIKYIVIHYTANDGDTDEANGNYFKNNIVKTSAHYFVDDDSVTQSVPDNYIAYSVGGSKYANTKGGSLYRICTNANSLSIELCDTVKDGKYDLTEATLKNAIELVRLKMNEYNIPIKNVIRHYDVTGKICPKEFVDSETAWNEFKNRIKSGIRYSVYIQDTGWQEEKSDGGVAGTTGQSKRIEAVKIFSNSSISYRVHVQDIGWQAWVSNGKIAGTIGQSKRIEAIEIKITEKIKATGYVQDIGWQKSVVGTDVKIGTEGRSLRLEALKLEFVV